MDVPVRRYRKAVNMRSTIPLVLIVIALGAVSASMPADAATVSLPLYSPTNPDHHNGTSDDVVVPVSVSPADGVTSMDLTFTYTASLMTATFVTRTGYTNAFTLTSNLSTPGTVVLHLSGPAIATMI